MSRTLYLPALQGEFGDWLYYVVLMKLSDISDRVGYAKEIHNNRKLGELIQRQLEDATSRRGNRVAEISEYIRYNKDRFFNSLLVGVYGGEPQWHPFQVEPKDYKFDAAAMYEAKREGVGFLELTGTERLFALDGQHRLAGIKDAITREPTLGSERLSVIFVAHATTTAGLQRTRRLFIALNKKAVPVARKDIIALDEVDLPAIITRRLVDEHPWFSKGQIDVERFAPNLPPGESDALLTLGGLYDLVSIIIPQIMALENKKELRESSRFRLEDSRIEFYTNLVVSYFEYLARIDVELTNYFESSHFGPLARKARMPDASRVLFRPVGLSIVTKALAHLRRTKSLEQSFQSLRRMPLLLNESPFEGVIWDSSRGRIVPRGASLAIRLLLYTLGAVPATEALKASYATFLGRPVEEVSLPRLL